MTDIIQTMPCRSAQRTGPGRAGYRALCLVIALLTALAGTAAQAQTVNCVIASNDGGNGFRTDEITNCRIDRSNGKATFSMKGETRARSYDAVERLTTRHLEVATYWLNRAGQLRMAKGKNPAGFDPAEFLQAASRATHGFVLIRKKRNGSRAMNVVYITDGVYRSIDFPGTDLRQTPSGFLTTGR